MDLGLRIKTARKDARLTQSELAKKAGIATITLQQYERGVRQPRLEQIKKIADALEVTVGTLLGADGLSSGVVSFEDIAHELNVPVKMVYDAVVHPEQVPNEIRDKIITVSGMLYAEFSDPEYQELKSALDQISFSLSKLNSIGRAKAVERVSELTEIHKYKRGSTD